MSSHLSDDLQEQYEDFRMLVRKATKETLDQPDWAVNTECVNLVKTVTDPNLLYEIAQLLMRRLRESHIRIVVLTLYLIDALAHHCGHALLLTFNDETFMQQIASVARKYHLSPSQRALLNVPESEDFSARAEAVSVCVELLHNWSEFFRARRAYYSNIVDMAEILESEGIGKPGNVRACSPSSPSVAQSQGYTTLASTSGADQSRRTQQVSPQLTNNNTHNTSSGNMLSDMSLTTNEPSTMYTTTNAASMSVITGTNASIANTSTANSYGVTVPLASIHEYAKPHVHSPIKTNSNTYPTTYPTTHNTSVTNLNTSNNNTNNTTSPPKHYNSTTTFKSEHPWLNREERGMQSKSDYSKTTLDSHEPRERIDSGDYNVPPYSPDIADAKHKTLKPTMEESKLNTNNLPASTLFSPVKTVTQPTGADNNASIEDEDFGVGGDLWEDSIELSPNITTDKKGLYVSTANSSPDKRSYIVPGSPQKPAQKALHEFLQSNTIDDVDLQEELLNQVEIEKRIQENNRHKQSSQGHANNVHKSNNSTHHSTQQQSTRTTTHKNTNHTNTATNTKNTNNSNASTLQHELTHQHEIEQSIREQMMHKQNTTNNHYNANTYTNNVQSVQNTKTHYTKTSKVNTNINTSTKSPLLEDIRNFQYSYDSNEQMVYNSDIMHSQSYDNAQVPPRSPHKREQIAGFTYPPVPLSNSNNNLGSGRLDTDSDDNYDGNVVDYADGTNQDFFFVPSTNTYIDTIERKPARPHTGSISSGDYYGGSSVGGMSNINSVRNTNNHTNHNNHTNNMAMGNMGIGHPLHPMHPTGLNPMNNAMNMYNLPGEFVSLTTTQYNFTKVPSFYSGMNMSNIPAITNINTMPMSTSPNYYNGGNSVHSPQPYAYPNTINPTMNNPINEVAPLLNTQSNNSLLLDQQIEQQKLILFEFERQKQQLLLQQQQQQNMQQNMQTSPRSTYSSSPLPNSPDMQQEVNLAKERLLRQQQTILASAPVVHHHNNNNNQASQQQQQVKEKKDTTAVANVNTHGGNSNGIVQNKKDNAKPPPVVQSSTGSPAATNNNNNNNNINNNASTNAGVQQQPQQRPRGVDNLTLRTSNNNITLDGTSVYGSISGASNNGGYSIPSRKHYNHNNYSVNDNVANRAAAGTPHSFAHTNDSLNPSLHAQRREKERHEQRKREIESEWAREQERAVEHTIERERPVPKNNTTQGNATTHSPLPSGGNIHTSRGRKLSITTSTSITGNHNEFDDNTVVSDLTSSTISSTSRTLYSKIDAEPVAPPLSRSDSDIIRNMYVENHLSTSILPLRGSSNKLLNAESSNNLSSTNTNTNTSTGVNTEDPVLQSVAKMLKQALDPAESAQTANVNNTSMSGGTIDRAKALAAAQLLIATLTGGTPPVSTTNTESALMVPSADTNVVYENGVDKSSSHESSRPYALSIDVSDVAVARTPRNSYKQKASGNTNTSTMSPKMEQYTTGRSREVIPAINTTISIDIPPSSSAASSGSAAGMPPRSPVKSIARSERYIVPDVIRSEQPTEENAVLSKNTTTVTSPVEAAVYPATTLTRNTVAMQSGISVITDDDSYFTKEGQPTQNTYNNLTSSYHHSAHERGRNRHRPPLNVGIGGMELVSDKGKPVNRQSPKGMHRSASMEPAPRHASSNTNTESNTNTSNSAGKLSTATDSNSSRKLHRSASLEPTRSPRSHSRDSSYILDDSVWNSSAYKGTSKGETSPYNRGSSNELHSSEPTSPLTEASGSPRYTNTYANTNTNTNANGTSREGRDNQSTSYSHNEASRHSKHSTFDSAADSQANFVASAILQHRNKTSPRGSTSRSVEREASKTINANYKTSVDNGSMVGTTSSLMESSYAQDSHLSYKSQRDVHSTARSASNANASTHNMHINVPYADTHNRSHSQRDVYDSRDNRDHRSLSPNPSSNPSHNPSPYEENTHTRKPRSSSRSRDREYRETIYNNPHMDVELYRASTTKEQRREDRQRERERRDAEKVRGDRRRDGNKSDGGTDKRSSDSYVSRSRMDVREERYEDNDYSNNRRSNGGDKYEVYDINDHRPEWHNPDERASRSDRDKADRKDRTDRSECRSEHRSEHRSDRRSTSDYRDDKHLVRGGSRDPRYVYHESQDYPPSVGRDRGSSYDHTQNNRTRTESNVNVHTGTSSAIMYSSSDRAGTRERADSSMSGIHSIGGKVSLVDIAKRNDPNYASERTSRPNSMSNRRIYEDDLNSRYPASMTSDRNSPMPHSPNPISSLPIVTTTAAELYPTTYAPNHHTNKSHNNSRNNLVSHSYDDYNHKSNSNMSVGYSSDRHPRRSSHEPAPVHSRDLGNHNRDSGNHRSSRDLRESGNHRENQEHRESKSLYENDPYHSQQSYVDDTSHNKRHSSRHSMEPYNHPHTSNSRETTHSPVNYTNHSQGNSMHSTSRPVSMHRSSSNKYESSAAPSGQVTKHSALNTSDDDITRLSRPIDPKYVAKANNLNSTSTHSISYPTTYPGSYNEGNRSNKSTPTAAYTNVKPSSSNISTTKAPTSSSFGTESRKMWACNMCTLENPPDFLACDACGMLRSK